jgi:hypothetical protein
MSSKEPLTTTNYRITPITNKWTQMNPSLPRITQITRIKEEIKNFFSLVSQLLRFNFYLTVGLMGSHKGRPYSSLFTIHFSLFTIRCSLFVSLFLRFNSSISRVPLALSPSSLVSPLFLQRVPCYDGHFPAKSKSLRGDP